MLLKACETFERHFELAEGEAYDEWIDEHSLKFPGWADVSVEEFGRTSETEGQRHWRRRRQAGKGGDGRRAGCLFKELAVLSALVGIAAPFLRIRLAACRGGVATRAPRADSLGAQQLAVSWEDKLRGRRRPPVDDLVRAG